MYQKTPNKSPKYSKTLTVALGDSFRAFEAQCKKPLPSRSSHPRKNFFLDDPLSPTNSNHKCTNTFLDHDWKISIYQLQQSKF